MTQDQYGQARGPGYVVRDDAVPDDETEEFATGESKPMTRFQKVASALLGDKTDRDEADQDQAAANRDHSPRRNHGLGRHGAEPGHAGRRSVVGNRAG